MATRQRRRRHGRPTSTQWRSLILLLAYISPQGADAHKPGPFVLPATEWLGIDGNWSTLAFKIGSPPQEVNVLPSTSLSEFWAVGPGGCLPNEPRCSDARGGIYTPDQSNRWSPMGSWSLGLDYLGYGGNGLYGRDKLATFSPISNRKLSMSDSLISSFNTTDYYVGYFGLGITQGRFGEVVADSPLTQAVKSFGIIPSYSYGYTAGAHYRELPASLTLGGTDNKRFIPHDIDFTLGEFDNLPRALIRGIEFMTPQGQDAPPQWNASFNIVSNWDTAFEALVDTTTPYLWLPDPVCDKIALAFNLTYNDTIDLYTISDEQYRNFSSENAHSVTFSFSSFDNHDNFGNALSTPGVVNITIPMRALVSTLRYPFMNEVIEYGDPAIPYLTVRRANTSSTFIVGRAFLQESYLIAEYDKSVFSIHQGLFPPQEDTDIRPIERPPNSPYPPPYVPPKSALTKAEIGGLVVGVLVALMLLIIGIWLCRKRRRDDGQSPTTGVHHEKEFSSTQSPTEEKGSISKIFGKFGVKLRPIKRDSTSEQPGLLSEAPDNMIYELSAPVPPVELDNPENHRNDDDLGLEDNPNLSDYEQIRRRLDLQIRGPVPEYSPADKEQLPPPEKFPFDNSPVALMPVHPTMHLTRRQTDQQLRIQSTPISPVDPESNSSNSMGGSLPSPVSPRTGSIHQATADPSPTTGTGSTLPSACSTSQSHSTDAEQTSDGQYSVRSRSPQDWGQPSTLPANPPSVLQRMPIDPSNVVCLGPLPDHIQPPLPGTIPQIIGPDGTQIQAPGRSPTPDQRVSMDGSLGSNFTDDEEDEDEQYGDVSSYLGPESVSQQELRQQEPARTVSSASRGQERIDPSHELIHVPQMASKRYSWENE